MKKTANNFILYIFIHYYYQYHTLLHVKEHAVEEKTVLNVSTNRRKN